jgi:glycine/D-amino acid oxidase-like deaminating enzyme
VDGFASAYLTGRAFGVALRAAGADVREQTEVIGVDRRDGGFALRTTAGQVRAGQLVLAGGVWLEPMAAWLGLDLPVRVLINQLCVTERMPPVMRTQLGIANGMLSLKQFENGTVLIGGGWQGIGTRADGRGEKFIPENLIGNMRLAAFVLPALRRARAVRAWLGLEAKTEDDLPVLGPIPGVEGAWMIGCSHSGYTSGPFMGKLLADAMLGRVPDLPLFPPDRLLRKDAA